MKYLTIISIFIISFIIFTSNVYSLKIIQKDKYIIVPPNKFRCATLVFFNDDKKDHFIYIFPVINKQNIGYVLGMNISNVFIHLLPGQQQTITICFKSYGTTPPKKLILNINITIDFNIIKTINYTIFYNYYYDFRIYTIKVPPVCFYTEPRLLLVVENIGNKKDEYIIRIENDKKDIIYEKKVHIQPYDQFVDYLTFQNGGFFQKYTVIVMSNFTYKRIIQEVEFFKCPMPKDIIDILQSKIKIF